MIPGAHENIGVMKHWVRDALYALRVDYDRSAFLTNVLKLTSLLFAFDESSALQCIKQAHFNASHARVAAFVYPDSGRYVLEDIVSLFDGTQQTCISAGLLFLRYVWYRNARSSAAAQSLSQARPEVFAICGFVRLLRLLGNGCQQDFHLMASFL